MEAKIQDVYICQQERTDELNNRIMNRNYSTHQMTPKYFSRPVSNRRVLFPKVDNYKEMTVNKGIFKNMTCPLTSTRYGWSIQCYSDT